MKIFVLIMLASVMVSSISQIILKTAADREYPNRLREYLNIRVISAYSMFFLSSLLSIIALKKVPLSMGTILETTGYVFVAVFSFFILEEKITKQRIKGMVLIIIGVIIYGV
ncbi:MAG: EamA family transporter [Clostridiales bacterium]|nr:EamA family transporter [Clostridiales bacterium]